MSIEYKKAGHKRIKPRDDDLKNHNGKGVKAGKKLTDLPS
jgi:hypothetical protein